MVHHRWTHCLGGPMWRSPIFLGISHDADVAPSLYSVRDTHNIYRRKSKIRIKLVLDILNYSELLDCVTVVDVRGSAFLLIPPPLESDRVGTSLFSQEPHSKVTVRISSNILKMAAHSALNCCHRAALQPGVLSLSSRYHVLSRPSLRRLPARKTVSLNY